MTRHPHRAGAGAGAAGPHALCLPENAPVYVSVQTDYVYDGMNPVQELGAAGPSAQVLTSLGVSEYNRRTDAAGPKDLLTDALGSGLALADESGQLKTTYQYEPY